MAPRRPGARRRSDARHAKTPFQFIVRARQALNIVALKQPCSEIGGLVTKMVNRLSKQPQSGFLLLHLRNVSQIPFTHLSSRLLLVIGQNVSRLMDEIVRAGPRETRGWQGLGALSQGAGGVAGTGWR
jgi:hypothetical protein